MNRQQLTSLSGKQHTENTRGEGTGYAVPALFLEAGMTERTMAQLHFTSWLRELVPSGPLTAGGGTVGEALGQVFTELPHVRGYLLDDGGQLRKHVCIFADGKRLPREAALSQSIRPDSTLYVMQALSGG
jgi:hypothetical protein